MPVYTCFVPERRQRVFSILKKDIKRKKVMNAIVLIFIVLGTVFMASSVSNLGITSSAISYFAEKTNAPDYIFAVDDNDAAHSWIEQNKLVKSFTSDETIPFYAPNIELEGQEYTSSSWGFLSRVPRNSVFILDENNQVITNMEEGEIALTYDDAESNNLKLGDTITVSLGNTTKYLDKVAVTFLSGKKMVAK